MTSQPSGVILKVLRHPLLYAALIIAAAAIEGGVPFSIGASPLASEVAPSAAVTQDPAAP
jgi:hypothetical protein